MLIALTGPAGSGKTIVALEFEKRGFVRVRFADTLKRMLRTLGLNEAQVDGDAKASPAKQLCGKTPRHAMQTLGTEWGRALIGKDVWVRAAMRTVDDLLAARRDVVIDDCRFDNEAVAVLARKGYVVQLVRGGAGLLTTHESEQGVNQALVDTFIFNNLAVEATADTVLLRVEEVQSCRNY